MAKIGIDRHQFHDNFVIANEKTPGTKASLYGGGEEVRSRLLNTPNARILPKSEKAKRLFKEFSSILLIPDRIWLDTTHVTSTFTSEPVMSNIFYSVKLKKKSVNRAKALCLWLNTTWGMLTILASRQETRGRWISLKMGHWKLLPVLDVISLSREKLAHLGALFDEFVDMKWRRLPEQFTAKTIQKERVSLDLKVLKIIRPDVNISEAEDFLRRELYTRIADSLRSWMG